MKTLFLGLLIAVSVLPAGAGRAQPDENERVTFAAGSGLPIVYASTDSGAAATGPTLEGAESFDVGPLPRIEDLTADSDVTAFMDVRVPNELRNAALRRAWVLDPKIRDFMEMAENQLDFGERGGVPPSEPVDTAGAPIESALSQAAGCAPQSEPPSRAASANSVSALNEWVSTELHPSAASERADTSTRPAACTPSMWQSNRADTAGLAGPGG